MPRGWCARLVEALCRCFRSAGGGNSGNAKKTSSRSFTSSARYLYDLSLNITMYGECGVGKTSLRNRWVDGVFTGDVVPTFGVDFNIKTLDLIQDDEVDYGQEQLGKRLGGVSAQAPLEAEASEEIHLRSSRRQLLVKINVYDTSGKPGYREVNNTYLLAFDAVLFVYDITAKRTLDELRRYFNDPENREKLEARRKAGMTMLLVGNKSDVVLSQRQVGSQTGQDAAAEFGIPFMEVSAKSGANVRDAFMSVATKAVREHLVRDKRRSAGLRKALRRTGKKDQGIQRALKAKTSVLGLFSEMTTRRKYVQRTKSGTLLTVSPEEEDLPSTTTTTPIHHHHHQWADISQGQGAVIKAGIATKTASAAVDESKAGDEDRFPLLPAPSTPPGAVDPRRATAAPRPGLCDHTPAAAVTSLMSSPMRSSIVSTSAVERSSRSTGFVRFGGRGDLDGARTSLERSTSPQGRERHPVFAETRSRTVTDRRRRCLPLDLEQPFTAGGASPRAVVNSSTAATAMSGFPLGEHRRSTSLRGGEGVGRTRTPGSPILSSRSRPRVHFSPRAQLTTGRELVDRSLSPTRGRNASPDSGDGGGTTMGSARKSLRAASSFWLDQWGIKEERTDATRESHTRIRSSPAPSPRGDTRHTRRGRLTSPRG